MRTITLSQANQLIAKAIAIAESDFNRRPISVAICDAQGFLMAFSRMDGAPVRGIEISQGKAYTAARMGVNTNVFLERLHRENILPSYFCDNRLTGLPGGAVLKHPSGQAVGAAGISGLTSAEDQVIANALAETVANGLI